MKIIQALNKIKDESSREYLEGFRDATLLSWDDFQTITMKNYTPHELQIMMRSEFYGIQTELKKAFEDLNRKEAPADAAQGVPAIEFRPGQAYAVNEPKPAEIFRLCASLISDGRKGVCVVRANPAHLREDLGIKPEKFVWLTTTGSTSIDIDVPVEGGNPGNLSTLFSKILGSIGEQKEYILLFEGIEYLLTHNEFKSIQKFIQQLYEHVVADRGMLMVALSEVTMEEKNFSKIVRDIDHVIKVPQQS